MLFLMQLLQNLFFFPWEGLNTRTCYAARSHSLLMVVYQLETQSLIRRTETIRGFLRSSLQLDFDDMEKQEAGKSFGHKS